MIPGSERALTVAAVLWATRPFQWQPDGEPAGDYLLGVDCQTGPTLALASSLVYEDCTTRPVRHGHTSSISSHPSGGFLFLSLLRYDIIC
jgi:hypothetical protein